MANTSSITDIPRNSKDGEKDNFGITPYEQGLEEFIAHANTPLPWRFRASGVAVKRR